MALIDTFPIFRSPASGIASWFGQTTARRRARREQKRAIAELRGLPASMMKDLAFDRSEITSVVREGRQNRR